MADEDPWCIRSVMDIIIPPTAPTEHELRLVCMLVRNDVRLSGTQILATFRTGPKTLYWNRWNVPISSRNAGLRIKNLCIFQGVDTCRCQALTRYQD
jgi:hypothetical protein